MYVEKRGEKYRAEVRMPGTRKKIRKTFDYEHQAEAWARAMEADMDNVAAAAGLTNTAPAPTWADKLAPVVGTPCGVTVNQHAVAWLATKATKAKATRVGYAWHVAEIAATDLGSTDMGTITRNAVRLWINDMDAAGVGRPTINARLKVLRMVYLDAMAEGLPITNPTHGVDDLTVDIRPERVLSRAEEARVWEAYPNAPELRAFILAALDGGLRWGEVAGLTVGSVVGDVLVVRQVVESTTRSIRKYPKGHRARNVEMTEELAAALAPIVAAAGDDMDALLFTNDAGHLLDYANWRRAHWLPVLRAAKIPPGFRFHDLRHTCGTRLADAGMPRHQIAQFLGHADEATTARYIHSGESGARVSAVRKALGRKAA